MLHVLQDIGARPYQEDRYAVHFNFYNGYDYIAIFDGHGGHQVSQFLKFYLHEFVKKHLATNSPLEALGLAFEEAHNTLPRDIAYATGSAALVILKKQNHIWVANAGDCRAIMNSHSNAIALSRDHKPHDEYEFKRITSIGGRVYQFPNDVPRVEGNLALSRSIGDKQLNPYVSWLPEVKEFVLKPANKYILLASDGLWDVFSNKEVVDMIYNYQKLKNKKKFLQAVNNNLLQAARARGSQDNITILLYTI